MNVRTLEDTSCRMAAFSAADGGCCIIIMALCAGAVCGVVRQGDVVHGLPFIPDDAEKRVRSFDCNSPHGGELTSGATRTQSLQWYRVTLVYCSVHDHVGFVSNKIYY